MTFRVSWVRSAGNPEFFKGQHSLDTSLFLLCKTHAAPDMPAPGTATTPCEASLTEAAAELPLCFRPLPALIAPALITRVEVLGIVPVFIANLATVGEEPG